MVLFCHSVCLPVWLADWLAVCLSVCLRVCAAVYETKISRRINLSFKHYRATQRDCFSLPARVAKHTRLQTMTANASALLQPTSQHHRHRSCDVSLSHGCCTRGRTTSWASAGCASASWIAVKETKQHHRHRFDCAFVS